MKTIKGNLIGLGLAGNFDVIAHGCNCFCAQKSGIASAMSNVFGSGNPKYYKLEGLEYRGDKSKLGKIEGYPYDLNEPAEVYVERVTNRDVVHVVNCYTQYSCGTDKVYVDYDVLRSCMRQLNDDYFGLEIGLPRIGCGLAGGDWNIVKKIIEEELRDCDVTIVEL